MSRVNLQEQPKYEFSYKTTIDPQNLNYAGHLGNDSLVRMIQKARMAIFEELGFKEIDLGDGKTGIIIADLVVNFKAEGFDGEVLLVESHIGDVTDKSFRIYHRIRKEKESVLLALAETGLVCFDYERRVVCEIPEGFKKD